MKIINISKICSGFILLLIIFCPVSAISFSEQDAYGEVEDKWKPLEVVNEAISWDLFAQTTETEECSVDSEGFDYCIIKPGYSSDLKSEDGKEVKLMGFMFPLEHSEKQSHFLLGPYPLSCPFHYHVGPSLVIEVSAKKPIEFSYDPVTLKGTLKLKFNEENGVFYYLESALPAK